MDGGFSRFTFWKSAARGSIFVATNGVSRNSSNPDSGGVSHRNRYQIYAYR